MSKNNKTKPHSTPTEDTNKVTPTEDTNKVTTTEDTNKVTTTEDTNKVTTTENTKKVTTTEDTDKIPSQLLKGFWICMGIGSGFCFLIPFIIHLIINVCFSVSPITQEFGKVMILTSALIGALFCLISIIVFFSELIKISVNVSFKKIFKKEKLTPLEAIGANVTNIKAYHGWSIAFSVFALLFSIIISIAGLVVIYKATQNPHSTAVVLSAIGGIIAEFVSATGIFVFRLTIKYQKNYYNSLHENERVLTSLSVVENIENDLALKNELYAQIIKSQLEINATEAAVFAARESDMDYKPMFGFSPKNQTAATDAEYDDSDSNEPEETEEKTEE